MLTCHVRGCTTNNFPLRIEDAEIEKIEADFNPEFLERLVDKLEWNAVIQTAHSVIIYF
jgi:multifunctional methyltransferase subunit TRM112